MNICFLSFSAYHTVWYAEKLSKARDIWLEVGLDLLVEYGPEGLTIERMCQRMNKTKGSFYHHFRSRSQFESDLLEFWEEMHTRELIHLTQGEVAHLALKKLHSLARALPFERESAFRDWARQSQQASRVVERVDQTRAAHLKGLYKNGGWQESTATTLAWLEYSLFLGTALLGRSLPKKERKNMRKLFERWVKYDRELD